MPNAIRFDEHDLSFAAEESLFRGTPLSRRYAAPQEIKRMETAQQAFDALSLNESDSPEERPARPASASLTHLYPHIVGTIAFRFDTRDAAPVAFFVTTTHGFSSIVECRDEVTQRLYGTTWVQALKSILRDLHVTHLVVMGDQAHWYLSRLLKGEILLTLDQNDRLRYRCSDCQSFHCIRTLAILALKRSIRRFKFNTQHSKPL